MNGAARDRLGAFRKKILPIYLVGLHYIFQIELLLLRQQNKFDQVSAVETFVGGCFCIKVREIFF
jgi:hypothetical protein